VNWRIILHGGARSIAPGDAEANRQGALQALACGVSILDAGGRALDAAEAVVRALEDNPVFNAGRGSVRNRDGEIELAAAIMDGATLDVGAVAVLRNVRNPVSVARRLLGEETVLLAGPGAQSLAREIGAEPALCDPRAPASPCDTVGCVALDAAGHSAAAISTGGLHGVRAGRVGDAPLPGCGFYADDQTGAVCFSGDGERIMRTTLAARAVAALESGAAAQSAAEAAIGALARVGGEAGAIVIDRAGRFGCAHNSSHFTVALQSANDPPRVALQRSDLKDV